MNCGSNPCARMLDREDKDKLGAEVLQHSRVRFTRQQFQTLNFFFTQMLADDDAHLESNLEPTKSIAERLTQRLVCGVGSLDPRFASKYLVRISDFHSTIKQPCQEYLIRLDTLSSPPLYPDDRPVSCDILEHECDGISPGHARIRLRNKTSTQWTEFINSSGFLRRDKIQERYVELLALAAAGTFPGSPLDVDESVVCGSPGKVVDALTLHRLLHLPPEEHIYYGASGNCERFPDPRDFRLAIVDEPSGIRLRIGFLSPSLDGADVEVRLVLGVGMDGWSASADLPSRIPLSHTEALLLYQAAETGMYLTTCGSHATNWQIKLPAAETAMLDHHGSESTVTRVLKVLYNALDEIQFHQTGEHACKFTNKLLDRISIRTALFYHLEMDSAKPSTTIINWTSRTLSLHVLQLLDYLLGCLRQQIQPSYFYPSENLLGRGSNICEADFVLEANGILMYLVKLQDIAMDAGNKEMAAMIRLEEVDGGIATRWADVVGGLLPPADTRGRRMSLFGNTKLEGGYVQYTPRQLKYIGMLLKKVLIVKQLTLQPIGATAEDLIFPSDDPIEDIIYLLVVIMEQARDQSSMTSRRSKHRTKYDLATTKLVEIIRRDKELARLDMREDVVIVRTVLKWLYRGMDHSKSTLAPVLRPYLGKLFTASHELSFHLDSMVYQEVCDELKAMGTFCRIVNESKMTPASGLVESVNKGWCWPQEVLFMVERASLRVVLTPSRGREVRHVLSLPSYEKDSNFRSVEHTLRTKTRRRHLTLPASANKQVFDSIRKGQTTTRFSVSERSFSHDELRNTSPMTQMLKMMRRFGIHRGQGDLIQALVSLRKISVLQELANLLAEPERRQMLDAVHKLNKEDKRRRYSTLPSIKSAAINSKRRDSGRQIYTPTVESAGIATEAFTYRQRQIVLKEREIALSKKMDKDSLIGSCRAARLRDDMGIIFPENFRVKSFCRLDNV